MTTPEHALRMPAARSGRLALGSADDDLAEAVRAAETAALASGVEIRPLTALAELDEAVALFGSVWGRTGTPPLSVELLRALTKAGNYVGGAFAGPRLVGACVAFFHAPAEDALHSHIAGVAGDHQRRQIGFALKLHQRAWALLQGVAEIVWTFDPLVARNAYFNLAKLSARPREYLPNFYGVMPDAINGGDDTDRLLVGWPLADPAVAAACAGRPPILTAAEELAAGAVVGLDTDLDGRPRPGRTDGASVLVACPRDIEALRVTDPALANRWRLALRETLQTLLTDQAHITGFDRAGWYVVRREEA